MECFVSLALVGLVTIWPASLRHGDAVQAHEFQHAAECGSYALIAAAMALGVDVNAEAVLAGTRMSAMPGSTSLDICESARSIGLWASAYDGVTADSLRYSAYPLLLLLKTEMREECAGHWVAYLGEDQGKAIVFDVLEAERVRLVDYGELSLLMSGVAVMVGLSPPSTWEQITWQLSTLDCLWPLLLVSIIIVIPNIYSWVNKQNMMVAIVVLLVASIILTLLNLLLTQVSPLSDPALVAWVQSRHVGDSFAEVGFDQLVALQRQQEVTLVDARLPAQFATGHIPGAINVPVSLRATDLAARTKLLPRSRLVIVYCASRECDWDQTIAQRLFALGFTNIRIFQDGLTTYAQRAWRTTP